jgi:membrane-associated phospholipid phosphatase
VPATYSFPSGHALFSMCFYTTIAWLLAREMCRLRVQVCLVIVAATLIILIGLTRIYLGVHYPSDVIAGYLAAGFWLCIVCSVSRLTKSQI